MHYLCFLADPLNPGPALASLRHNDVGKYPIHRRPWPSVADCQRFTPVAAPRSDRRSSRTSPATTPNSASAVATSLPAYCPRPPPMVGSGNRGGHRGGDGSAGRPARAHASATTTRACEKDAKDHLVGQHCQGHQHRGRWAVRRQRLAPSRGHARVKSRISSDNSAGYHSTR